MTLLKTMWAVDPAGTAIIISVVIAQVMIVLYVLAVKTRFYLVPVWAVASVAHRVKQLDTITRYRGRW